MKQVVKVQGPLSASSDGPPWLIYAEGKKMMETRAVALISQSVKSAMGNDPKGYFEAEWSVAEGWKIGDRIKDQDW